jgi:predicted membrane-bound spermidine synthase
MLALAIALGAVALPQLLLTLARWNASRFGEGLAPAVIALFTFSIAVLAGAQFPAANALAGDGRNAAARLYTADFVGASIGALLASTLLLPLLGVTSVCAITGALNLLAALVIFRKVSFA